MPLKMLTDEHGVNLIPTDRAGSEWGFTPRKDDDIHVPALICVE